MSEPADIRPDNEIHAAVTSKMAGVVDRSVDLSYDEQQHIESCLQCQAELVRYRKVLRALRDLRTQVIHPAPGVLAGILDNLAEDGERRAIRAMVTGRRAAYTGGIAVAALAGVTGAVLLAGRSRNRSRKAA